MNSSDQSGLRGVDASTFQKPLAELSTTLSLKVQREGPRMVPVPIFFCADIYLLLRYATHDYALFFYMNADEKRHKEVGWRVGIAATILPLVRSTIDALYNVSALLQEPANAFQYRKSGYKRILEALDTDEKRYAGDPRWDEYITDRRSQTHRILQHDGFTVAEVLSARYWPTLGKYLQGTKNVPLTPLQIFLKELTYGMWQEYSSLSHATFDGLLPTAYFFMPTDLPHEERPKVDEAYERTFSVHISRVAGILLCMLTEVQAFFQFNGANINSRLQQMWSVLMVAEEIKELYDARYKKLMEEKGITS